MQLTWKVALRGSFTWQLGIEPNQPAEYNETNSIYWDIGTIPNFR